MTKTEFWVLAEDWYQRTHRLRRLAENETETEQRKAKALRLFLAMVPRMLRLAQMAHEAEKPKRPIGMSGGIKVI